MLQRQVLHCLQQPLLHAVWTGGAAAAGPVSATTAAPAARELVGALSAASRATINWRGFSTEATSFPAAAPADAPWSAGVASSSSNTTSRQGPPEPAILRPDMFANSFRSPITPLQFNRGEVVYLPQLEGNMAGRALLYLVGAYSQKQQLRNGASVLYQGITEAAESTDLQQALGLEVGSFMAPFNLLSLHMWLIINRLHQEPETKESKIFLHALYHDYFYKDIERRVYAHGVQIRVGKWVDKLQKQFYGTSFAYDKAIRAEGGGQAQQAALVAALLKNVYNAEEINKPWAELTARYLLRELQCLGTTDVSAIYKGHVRFSFDIVKQQR